MRKEKRRSFINKNFSLPNVQPIDYIGVEQQLDVVEFKRSNDHKFESISLHQLFTIL